ncbi:MAG: hypothetical protein PHY56_06515, partial [Candidatus Omnitrophica bacterium]|nr:hypothetical protein [Candidatus Omnitrophota bacterium]
PPWAEDEQASSFIDKTFSVLAKEENLLAIISQPGSNPGSQPGSNPGSQPGSNPGSQPGSNPVSQPISLSISSNTTIIPGQTFQISWSAIGLSKVNISLYKGKELVGVIGKNLPAMGYTNPLSSSFYWKVPSDLQTGTNYYICVYNSDHNYNANAYNYGEQEDCSNKISVQKSSTQSIEITAPNGESTLGINSVEVGKSYTIKWKSKGVEKVDILLRPEIYEAGWYYAATGEAINYTQEKPIIIASGVSSTGKNKKLDQVSENEYVWNVPNMERLNNIGYRIIIRDSTCNCSDAKTCNCLVSDESDASFKTKRENSDCMKDGIVFPIGASIKCCKGLTMTRGPLYNPNAVERDYNTSVCIKKGDGICDIGESSDNSSDCKGKRLTAELGNYSDTEHGIILTDDKKIKLKWEATGSIEKVDINMLIYVNPVEISIKGGGRGPSTYIAMYLYNYRESISFPTSIYSYIPNQGFFYPTVSSVAKDIPAGNKEYSFDIPQEMIDQGMLSKSYGYRIQVRESGGSVSATIPSSPDAIYQTIPTDIGCVENNNCPQQEYITNNQQYIGVSSICYNSKCYIINDGNFEGEATCDARCEGNGYGDGTCETTKCQKGETEIGSSSDCFGTKNCCCKDKCQDLWWYDNQNLYCQKKMFCNNYNYSGLRTFSTQSDCEASLRKNCISGLIYCKESSTGKCKIYSNTCAMPDNCEKCSFPQKTCNQICKDLNYDMGICSIISYGYTICSNLRGEGGGNTIGETSDCKGTSQGYSQLGGGMPVPVSHSCCCVDQEEYENFQRNMSAM